MVGPVPESERVAFRRLVKVGVTLLVGVSTGLVAIQTDANLVQVGGATLAGLAVGAALAWYIVPDQAPLEASRARPDRENPFRDDGTESDDTDGETRQTAADRRGRD